MRNFKTYLMLGYRPGYTLAGDPKIHSFLIIHRSRGHSVSSCYHVILINRSA